MQRNFRLIIYASIVIRHTCVLKEEEPAEMMMINKKQETLLKKQNETDKIENGVKLVLNVELLLNLY